MKKTDSIIIGTRASKLALWQSEHIKEKLQQHFPGLSIEVKKIQTTGDKILDSPLAKIGDKGLFTKQIEVALLDGEIDLAVHSLKDLPTAIPEGLTIGAITRREDPRDAFVSKNGVTLDDLPPGAFVATSSLRRRAQLLAHRPDICLEDIRGNVDTRLSKLEANENLSAIILANAGLTRMGFEKRITHLLQTDVMLPAVGQGALGIEIRQDDQRVREIVATQDHVETRAGTLAERALLAKLEGGCQVPIGAYGRVENEALILDGLVASLDGTTVFRDRVEGSIDAPEALGLKLAEMLIGQGADEVLAQINRQARGGP